MLFNDATLSFQGWLSCASCHSHDARVDGLNWDLLNDGIGNPKNTKSLLWAHRTPPAMSTGVRETAETAVRAGLSHILFSVQSEDVAASLDIYLRSLEPVPSPRLEEGRLSPAALRGEVVFRSPQVGCGGCHSGGLRTDLKAHDVGTTGRFDQAQLLFDTPALVELWRTAPFLHDGSCASLYELVTSRNRDNRHGRTAHLSKAQVDDLVEYLLSL
jgi:cytochrome c peroxidase